MIPAVIFLQSIKVWVHAVRILPVCQNSVGIPVQALLLVVCHADRTSVCLPVSHITVIGNYWEESMKNTGIISSTKITGELSRVWMGWPVSQNFPVYPSGQIQLKRWSPAMQDPPFLQGLGSQVDAGTDAQREGYGFLFFSHSRDKDAYESARVMITATHMTCSRVLDRGVCTCTDSKVFVSGWPRSRHSRTLRSRKGFSLETHQIHQRRSAFHPPKELTSLLVDFSDLSDTFCPRRVPRKRMWTLYQTLFGTSHHWSTGLDRKHLEKKESNASWETRWRPGGGQKRGLRTVIQEVKQPITQVENGHRGVGAVLSIIYIY